MKSSDWFSTFVRTLPFIGVAMIAVAIVIAAFLIGVPSRSLYIVLILTAILGPFIAVYSFMFTYLLERDRSIPVLIVDPDHQELGLELVQPTAWDDVETEGALAERRGLNSGQTVHISEGSEVRAEDLVDVDSGETVTNAVRVYVGTWEAEVDHLEFLEDREVLTQQRHRLVPLAKAGLEARAGADLVALENSLKTAHGILAGAESDEFLKLDPDPFDFTFDAREVVDGVDSGVNDQVDRFEDHQTSSEDPEQEGRYSNRTQGDRDGDGGGVDG